MNIKIDTVVMVDWRMKNEAKSNYSYFNGYRFYPLFLFRGMVYNFLPFMILPIHTSLTNMDKSLTEASMDLGASRIQTFFKVTFRLSLSGVLTGVTMVFLPAISAFVIPKMLGGGQYSLIGNFIEQQFITVGNWHFGSAVSLVLAVIVIILMALIYKVEKRTNVSDEKDEGGKRSGKRKKIRKNFMH